MSLYCTILVVGCSSRYWSNSCALKSKTEDGVFLHEHAIRFFHLQRQKWAPIINGTMTTKATFMDILDLSMEIIYFFKINNAKA